MKGAMMGAVAFSPRHGVRVELVRPAPCSHKRGQCWWARPFRSGQPTDELGWVAVHDAELEEGRKR